MTRFLSLIPCALLLLAPAAAPSARGQELELDAEQQRLRSLYVAFDDEGAFAAANDYLVTHPGDAFALEVRARALRQLGRMKEAADTAELIRPESTRTRLLLAECLALVPGGAERAQKIVDELAAEDPNAVEPHMARARVFMATGRFKEADAEVAYVTTVRPKLYEGQLLGAMLAELGGFYDVALKRYLPLVTKKDDFPDRTDTHHELDAVKGLAGCHMKLRQYEEALTLYEQLTGRLARNGILWGAQAQAQAMLYRTGDAIASWEKAVELAPHVPEFHMRLAEAYRQTGRIDDAVARYEYLLANSVPGPAQALADMRLGELQIEKGQLDRAKRHLEAALALMPEAEDVIAANGRLRELLGDAPGAIDHYRRALAKNPLRYEALYRLAMLLSRSADEAQQKEGAALMERHKKAEPFLIDIERTQRELEINRGSALLLTQLAGLLNLAGEYSLAKQWGEQSFRINRSSPSTCIQLAYISANLGDNPTALKYFERAQTLLPKGSVPKLDEYVEKLRKGEPLELPMGEIYRPQQRPGQPPPAPAGTAGEDPEDGAAAGDKPKGK